MTHFYMFLIWALLLFWKLLTFETFLTSITTWSAWLVLLLIDGLYYLIIKYENTHDSFCSFIIALVLTQQSFWVPNAFFWAVNLFNFVVNTLIWSFCPLRVFLRCVLFSMREKKRSSNSRLLSFDGHTRNKSENIILTFRNQ